MNQAYVFIKPHAVDNSKAIQFVKDVFEKNHIKILSSGEVNGSEIAEKGLIDKHYAVNAKVGTIADPRDLHINAAAKEKFTELFGKSWDEELDAGRVMSGLEAIKKLALPSGVALRDIWDDYGTKKITGGVYVADFKKEGLFVLNGFYPSIREIFTEPSARLLTFIVEFDPTQLSWEDFRGKVIGVTDPANAHESSIRGYLHAHGREECDIEVSCGSNVVHASASPFEAFVEKTTWIDGFKPESDPLWQLLNKKGIGTDRITQLFDENPFIAHDGIEEHLVDLLEDKDTVLVADIIAGL